MSKPKPFKKVLEFLTGKAPNLVGKIAGKGLDAVTGGTFGEIRDMITGSDELSPEQIQLALAEVNNDHEAYLAELADRQDARAMNVSNSKSEDRLVRRFPIYFAFAIIVQVTLLITGLIFIEIPEVNRPVIYSICGGLVGILIGIGAFHYGSSSGSKEKSGQLTQILERFK